MGDAVSAYRSELRAAESWMRELGLQEAPMRERADMVPEERFVGVDRRIMGSWPAGRAVAFNCFAVSDHAINIIREWVRCDAVLTIGWIDWNGTPLFKEDAGVYRDVFARRAAAADLNVHCWITLASMQIVDLSFGASVRAKRPEWGIPEGATIIRRPDELVGGMAYHPVAVGGRAVALFDEAARRHAAIAGST